LWYFASKDAGVAHTLSRRFFWSENVLWKEDIANYKTSIFLSERDLLVNTTNIRDYLLDLKKHDPAFHQNGAERDKIAGGLDSKKVEDRLNVIWCPDMDHSQIFDTKQRRRRLVKEVLSHCEKRQ
jgi:hypothetical protein